MTGIEQSVGQAGINARGDVRFVQERLNATDLTPLTNLDVDGRCGPRTVEAIRHFQVRNVGMQSPDSLVEPGGRTERTLLRGTSTRGTGQNSETRQADRTLRAERVDARVQETAATTRLIDRIVPQFGDVRARIIAGYLSDSDQFWKVNYHWEYLGEVVAHSLSLELEGRDRSQLENIRSSLSSCKPDPSTGYTSSPIGKPEDRSSAQQIRDRHRVVSSAKDQFRSLSRTAGLPQKSTRSPKVFDLAAAPIAAPGTSKHGTGLALDIEGDNAAIKTLCRSLGATLVFDEKSHVHVEFANG